MKTLKRSIIMLLFISLCISLNRAQAAPYGQQKAQASSSVAQDVSIIIEQEQVRFTAQKALAAMQLQIFDHAEQLVYDSGAVTEAELKWVVRQAGGETVRSGLYAYRLSVKEAGEETARVRRGYFIVDSFKDRYGKIERLWITTHDDGSASTEAITARKESATIDASAVSETESPRPAEAGAGKEELKERDKGLAAQAVNGTIGQIAKFTSATDLGDSVISEVNGKIGIGTGNPSSRLEIAAQDGLSITGYQPFLTLRDTNTGGKRGIIASGYGDLNFYPDSFLGQYPPVTIKNISGNVGIGTPDPGLYTRLQVVGNNTAINGYSPSGSGVLGSTSNGYAIYGSAGVNGYAAGFSGRVRVSGDLIPGDYGIYNLGQPPYYYWRAVYALNGTIQTSDARMKKEIADLRYGLRELMQLRPVSFEWKERGDGQQHLGLIAQETEKVIPEAVSREKNSDAPLGMNYTTLIPVVIKAIQEQQSSMTTLKNENEALQQRNTALQQQNADLDARLKALEQMMQQMTQQSRNQAQENRR